MLFSCMQTISHITLKNIVRKLDISQMGGLFETGPSDFSFSKGI